MIPGVLELWRLQIKVLTERCLTTMQRLQLLIIKASMRTAFKQLGVGFQATYSNMNIYTNKLTFEDQLAPDGTFSLPTSENFSGTVLKKSYLDLNAGVLFTSSVTENDNFYAGVSMYHITRPQMSFLPKDYQTLNARFTFQAGGYFLVDGRNTLHLSGIHSEAGWCQ